MKPIPTATNRRRVRRAFTLMELLVTISILGILAAILLPAMGRAIRRADEGKARNEVSQFAAAVKGYYDEFARWPMSLTGFTGIPPTDYIFGDKTIASGRRQSEVVGYLTTNNSKGISFLDVPTDSQTGTDRKGSIYAANDGYFLDPWGNPYLVVMDCNFDGSISNFTQYLDQPMRAYVELISPRGNGVFDGRSVGVMSYGSDPAATNSFIMSW